MRRPSIKLLAEVHRFDTLGTECGADGRCWGSIAGANDQLDHLVDCGRLLRHAGGGVVVPFLSIWLEMVVVQLIA